MSAATRLRRASVVLSCGPRCLMVADAGTEEGTCYDGGMSTVPPKLVPASVPDVSLPALELPALELEPGLEPVVLDSPLDYDEEIEELCVDCQAETSDECEDCGEPLCARCGDVCSWCENEAS